jgi:hypothetical protein
VIAGRAAVTAAAAAAACTAARLPVIRKLPVCNGQTKKPPKQGTSVLQQLHVEHVCIVQQHARASCCHHKAVTTAAVYSIYNADT